MLNYLARGNADNQAAIAKAATIPPFVSMLRERKDIAGEALWHLSGDSAKSRAAIAKSLGLQSSMFRSVPKEDIRAEIDRIHPTWSGF